MEDGCGLEEKREDVFFFFFLLRLFLRHSLFCGIMNALSGRIHQRSLWGEEMPGKVMVCWLLTRVAQCRKVIEVQKMSCCCTSSICIAVSQGKHKYCHGDAADNEDRVCLDLAKLWVGG